MGLVEIWLHLHDLGERLFGVLQRSVTVIEDADPIPKPGVLLRARVSTPAAVTSWTGGTLPSGSEGGSGPSDTRCMLAAARPSLDSSALIIIIIS